MTDARTATPGLRLLPAHGEMVRAYQTHDASYDGIFFTAVRTTGVFCRPSCRPPRLPSPENVEFFGSINEVIGAGYRPCKLCQPQAINGAPPEWVRQLMARVEADPSLSLKADDLRSLGVSPERARRWFVEYFGMTFSTWLRGRRLGTAFTRIREGADLDDVALGHGFESHSGFRDAFAKVFGTPPGKAAGGQCVFVRPMESPVGRLLAAATDQGICHLVFSDRGGLEDTLRELAKRHQCPVLPGTNPHLDRLRAELEAYFAGRLQKFEVPVAPRGTPFQEKVWAALMDIPSGTTISYQELAERIGQPTAMRAVARANGDNPVTVVIPCHRVIGKDGTLTGYGGGLWRKRLLLELERNGRLP